MHTQSLIPPLNLRQNKFKSGVRSKLSSASATKNKGNLVKKYGELQCQRQRQSSWSASCSSPLIFQDLSFVCGSFLDVFFSFSLAGAEEAANKCSEKTKVGRKYVGDSIKLSLASPKCVGYMWSDLGNVPCNIIVADTY